MRIALIPPIPELGEYQSTGIHLLLSHLTEHPEYVCFYRDRLADGDYLILDNSAHENGVGNDLMSLLIQSIGIGNVQEVVIPDVLFDSRSTYERGRAALNWLATTEGCKIYKQAGSPRLMFVPQGKVKVDWVTCLDKFLVEWEAAKERNEDLGELTIGVSKDYDYFRGGLVGLVQEYVFPSYVKHGFETHILGWPSDLWVLSELQNKCPWLRSTDSAKPFVYAQNEIRLEPGGKIPHYPKRSEDYFFKTFTPAQRATAYRNVEVFRSAAADELVTSPL